jgi:AraC family transcriptional regulator, arabinose operon regulatory protein
MDPRIQWATTELEQRIAEPVSVTQLAAAVNLSPSRFAHLFRDETGVSPMRYLHTQRMVRARVLLERTFLTVKQVMAQVGCGDPSHFARDFRRFHGMAPSECRAAGGGPRRITPWTTSTAADVPRPP